MEGISEDDRFNPKDNTKSKKRNYPMQYAPKELGYYLGNHFRKAVVTPTRVPAKRISFFLFSSWFF